MISPGDVSGSTVTSIGCTVLLTISYEVVILLHYEKAENPSFNQKHFSVIKSGAPKRHQFVRGDQKQTWMARWHTKFIAQMYAYFITWATGHP